MFLEMLNDEQKKLFLHLVALAANSNNIVEDAERDAYSFRKRNEH